MGRADWSRLTAFLAKQPSETVRVSWSRFDGIVGGVPASAVNHQAWWSGDRPHTRAWAAAGFVVTDRRPGEWVTFSRVGAAANGVSKPGAGSVCPDWEGRSDPLPVRPLDWSARHEPTAPSEAGKLLAEVDPRAVLLVVPCSAAKAPGGGSRVSVTSRGWPEELLASRAELASAAQVDESRLMPVWRRYTGHFYQAAGKAVGDAAHQGHLLILSGGYGLARATESIGDYNRSLRLADWPGGLLERLLVEECQTVGGPAVAFVADTTGYAKLLRGTAWNRSPNRRALLVTVKGAGGGAMRAVPTRLGHAFGAFWRQRLDQLPAGIAVEVLA